MELVVVLNIDGFVRWRFGVEERTHPILITSASNGPSAATLSASLSFVSARSLAWRTCNFISKLCLIVEMPCCCADLHQLYNPSQTPPNIPYRHNPMDYPKRGPFVWEPYHLR